MSIMYYNNMENANYDSLFMTTKWWTLKIEHYDMTFELILDKWKNYSWLNWDIIWT